MTLRDHIIEQIELYLVDTGINPTTFGRLACNDSAFVFRLRKGRDVTVGRADKVLAWMSEHPPPCKESVIKTA